MQFVLFVRVHTGTVAVVSRIRVSLLGYSAVFAAYGVLNLEVLYEYFPISPRQRDNQTCPATASWKCSKINGPAATYMTACPCQR